MKSTETNGAKTASVLLPRKVVLLQPAVIQKLPLTVPGIGKISLRFLRTL
jgi:hypothetical protein